MTWPRTMSALAAAAAAALALIPGAAEGRAIKAVWGPPERGAATFSTYRDLGISVYQRGLSWADVAPTKPRHPTDPRDRAYHWPAALTSEIRLANANHMRVLLDVLRTPAWANGHRSDSFAPRHPSDFANFLRAAARRYPTVHLWSIWAETTRATNWAPQVNPPNTTTLQLNSAQSAAPRLYAQVLDAAYSALKRASRLNLVIGGNTYTFGNIRTYQWIRYMRLPNGKPPRMDLFAHNPFSIRDPNFSNPQSPDGEVDFSDLKRLARFVDRNLAPRHRHIKLFLPEWTIPTAAGDSDFNFFTTEAVQAQWVTDAWRLIRGSSFIWGLGYIPIYDSAPGGAHYGGLLSYAGVPKPAYAAFKNG